jgi:hypothetical protein
MTDLQKRMLNLKTLTELLVFRGTLVHVGVPPKSAHETVLCLLWTWLYHVLINKWKMDLWKFIVFEWMYAATISLCLVLDPQVF